MNRAQGEGRDVWARLKQIRKVETWDKGACAVLVGVLLLAGMLALWALFILYGWRSGFPDPGSPDFALRLQARQASLDGSLKVLEYLRGLLLAFATPTLGYVFAKKTGQMIAMARARD